MTCRRLAIGAALVLAVTGCAGPNAVQGIVTGVDGDLTEVRSFDLRTTSGDVMSFQVDPLGDYAFPLPHLSSHMRSLDPVEVTYRALGDGDLVAVGVKDG